MSKATLKRTTVIVLWREGLHLRPAAMIVRCARQFASRITIRIGDRFADTGSVLSVVALCAMMGAALVIEATGDDEKTALDAVQTVFSDGDKDVRGTSGE